MSNEITIQSAEAVQAMTTAELDVAIATAKRYPRNVAQCLQTITDIATIDQDTAAECFYHLKRKDNVIDGLSIRLAEIIATSWQNLRVASRIVANDGRKVTAQAIAFDTEKNVIICSEVQRSILNSAGQTYSEDMQIVTSNAAQSIARRNSILSIVPKAVTSRAVKNIRAVALGQARAEIKAGGSNVDNMLKYFAGLGITEAQVCEYVGVNNRNEIDAERYMDLRGLAVSINEGTTTAKESIIDELARRRNDAQVAVEVKAADDKVTKSMNKNAKGGKK